MKTFLILFVSVLVISSLAAEFPPLNAQFGAARVKVTGSDLVVTTGAFERRWTLTPQGLRTLSVSAGPLQVIANSRATNCDWSYPGWLDASAPAELISLTAGESDDEGFTGRHLRVVAEFYYPAVKTKLRYEIWAYPGADGLRTQLWVKGDNESRLLDTSPAFKVLAGQAVEKSLKDGREIVFRVTDLQAAKQYTLELSAVASETQVQSVQLTSLDTETKVLVNDRWEVPGRSATPAVITVDLGSELRPDGSVTVRVSRVGKDGLGPVLTGVRVLEAGRQVAVFTNTSETTAVSASATTGQVEFLPATEGQLRAIGYYNDTQHRHEPDKHLLREETVAPGQIDWANIICLENERGGFALVKESHKCVNQPGVDTGGFLASEHGIAVTGWGVNRSNMKSDEWRWAWATWMVGYAVPSADDGKVGLAPRTLADAREFGLKQFQRQRYPVRADLDLYTKANTWGSGIDGDASVARASETEVLAEIDSVADLGLDLIQIDDGWQIGRMKPKQAADREWFVRPDWYPTGWEKVVARAQEKKVGLGIWLAARAPLAALQHHYDTGHFVSWKLDFANLSQYNGVQSYLAKGRDFIAYTGHKVRVNWDVTENAPRFGYFWASECGNVWLANRKPMQPANVVPRPWLMLRESREISRYLNLNKFELPIQNFAMVNPQISDAHLHSDTYATALGLSGIPVFFQTTRLLTPAQRTETKALLGVYKQVRTDLFSQFVLPIGDEPTNQGWSGFQWVRPGGNEFYVLLFRERLNPESSRRLALRWLPAGAALTAVDLRTGATSQPPVGADGLVRFSIEQPGDILFLKLNLL